MQTRREILQRFVGALAVSPPYVDRRSGVVEPGALPESAAPQDLKEVRIGYFGPQDSLWRQVCTGFDEANREGGYRGLPFRIVQKWTADPWRAGGRLVVEMAYTDCVWAIIGSVDAAATHVAEQVAVKARVPLVDAVSTDRTVNAAMVPWMFSCQPSDESIAAVIGERLLTELSGSNFCLVSATSHDERMLAREFLQFFARHKVTPDRHVEFTSGQVPQVDSEVVVLAANASDAAQFVRQTTGVRIYGGAACGRRQFLREAGPAGEGVRYPVMGTAIPGLDYAEAQSRDAARMVTSAVRSAGLTREGIRNALEEMSPWQGRGGEVRWNALHRNVRPVACGLVSRSNEWEASVIKES